MGRRRVKLASLCLMALGLAAAAPPRLEVVAYEPEGPVVLAGGEARAAAMSRPVRPGEQYPPTPPEDALAPAIAPPPAKAAPPAKASPPRRTEWRLAVDMSVTADSNVTNGTSLKTVPVDVGDGPLPVPVDPNLRERSGLGVGVSAAANVRIPISAEAAVAVDVEGYALEHEGPRSDDASALVAAGLEFGSGKVPDGSLQAIGFERWHGGVKAQEGIGLRGKWRHPLAARSNLRLAVDMRIFDSAYGDAFGGRQASLYVSYDSVLGRGLSGSLGVYARREWVGNDSFSSLDAGAYGGLSFFLGEDLAGGATIGLSRTLFDEPFLLLDPEAREDWRAYSSLWLGTRRPLAWGLLPSLTYTYNRNRSSIAYYDSDRHRVRLGLRRKF